MADRMDIDGLQAPPGISEELYVPVRIAHQLVLTSIGTLRMARMRMTTILAKYQMLTPIYWSFRPTSPS